MARQRLIKPEFFQHEMLHRADTVHALPLRLAFIGLWTQCDRRGLFKWEPVRLKLNVLPFDDVDFARVLEALHTEGFIESYEVEGRRYGRIPNFMKHQSFHVNEKADSSIPEYCAPPVRARRKHRASTVQAPEQHGASTPVTVDITDTVDIRSPRAGAASPKRDAWLAPYLEMWTSRVGIVTERRAAAALGPVRTQYGHEATLKGLEAYLDEPRPPDKPVKLEWFKQDAARWIREGQMPRTIDGVLTPRGERVSRSA